MNHNCTNPPHFPPHCGCPAEFCPGHPADDEKPKPHPEDENGS